MNQKKLALVLQCSCFTVKSVSGRESESDSPVFTADRLYEFSLVSVVFRERSLLPNASLKCVV